MDAKEHAIEIVEKHKRHVQQSPGIGAERQRYAEMVCDDILCDIRTILEQAASQDDRKGK